MDVPEREEFESRFRLVTEPAAALDAVLPGYLRDFPAEERKPEVLLRRLLAGGGYRLMTVRETVTNVRAAYLMGYPVDRGRCFFLDFLAVEPAFRGTGVGSWTVRALAETAGADGLFLELEIPGPDEGQAGERVRRLRFYERMGAFRLRVDYGLLQEDGGVFPMLLYYLPHRAAAPGRDAVEDALSRTFSITYGLLPERYPNWRAALARVLASVAL